MKPRKMDIFLGAIGFEKAKNYFGCWKEWAKRLKVRKQKLNYWILYGSIPCDKAMETHVLTKGHVRLVELRPDLKWVIEDYNKSIIDEYKKSIGLL